MRVKKLHPNAIIPTKAYFGDLGFDLYALEDTFVPGSDMERSPVVKVRTGIAIEFPPGWGAFIKDRSSVALKKKLHVVGGVIDNGYRGEIIVLMSNLSSSPVQIKAGEKIAQLVPIPLSYLEIHEVEEFAEETERGEKGFGSWDVKLVGMTI
jgi:dUTP pyrophosphatase